ncbi:3-(3-hydroxy-phenyl)propionate hydroxylase/6-hydroxy-3-succinoylpyridine 3-monooxygenase [Aminobacter aminovorans]|uniref:3-(3-hydroxy-phenyl)propionate hydroxylase/6-hydroxy-3-succinoylpyridine 3-monooxygenase n=2 Tax=Aminobacter aminovorans TaxID=83263 RepID=A0AAC8YWT0_AMIAI|nr:NAD(P)/FAD-dependent oxidoreductase [Aminobacter aminovorans]AMS45471.1 para-nitrophenol 4-monooxygenase [Aminobacter aminovorans]MBB3708678.1 3-(3-hydroxy-phenyl)propionate hydroxylase/6-hydroxy-3-succinoylpyridine 3-monooxygenase [Aminobacter aminovorans]
MSRHVIIVGGGPTGLLTALGLAKAGTRVTVLEAEPQLNDSPRALVYHYPVLPHLERMGLLQDCVAEGFLRQSFGWHIFSTGEMIEWDCLPESAAGQALHLHQGLFSKVLARHVAQSSNIEIRYQARLLGCVQHDDKVVAEIDGPEGLEQFDGDFLIGADGAGSTVRKNVLGLEFFGVTWPDRYIATNTRIDLSSCGYSPSVMQIDQKHGAVICKIDDSDVWRVTFVEDPSLPIERLPERIDAMFADHLPDLPYEVKAYAPYRMHQRVADKMRVGRILLVGDAAHVTNPTGGLGLTGGMFDAFALIEALNRVLQENASHDVLDFYERDRRRIFIEVTSVRASSNLRNLYQLKEGQQKEEFVQFLRTVAGSDELMRREMSFTEQLETRF